LRIASFVPAATELLASLGVRRRLVGVTHSCAGVADLSGLDLRVLTRCRVPVGGSSSAIDGAVKTAGANRSEVQVFDAAELAALQPDIVILPAERPGRRSPCMVDTVRLRHAVAGLDPCPRLMEYGPTSFREVHGTVRAFGEAVGKGAEAARLVADLRARIDRVQGLCEQAMTRPRVSLLSWIQPPVPASGLLADCVRLAGGVPLAAEKPPGAKSFDWQALIAAEPEVLLLAPCDFPLERARADAAALRQVLGLSEMPAARWGQVHVLDGRRWFSAPGLLTVRALEIIACLIHPELPWPDGLLPRDAWLPLDLD
jgi:iron complex transport system substrate-binding protein